MDAHSYENTGWIMYNHGIHGVQDMCNMLIRRGKDFIIEAGHIEISSVLDRIARHIKGAKMANQMRNARVGRIGEAFVGMGDFAGRAIAFRNANVTRIDLNTSNLRLWESSL